MLITDKDRVRRLVSLPDAKPHWTRRLRASKVAIVGMGGLGNTSGLYLAAQGVGHLALIDPDKVESHNLGRQILFGPADVGRSKVEAARQALGSVAPDAFLEAKKVALTCENEQTLLTGYDVIVDGLDNWKARVLLNHFSVRHRIPVVFGGAIGYEAQVYVVDGGNPCMQCLFGDDPYEEQDCAVQGVLGPVVGMAGTVQAQEVLKSLLNTGDVLRGRIWTYDAFRNLSRVVPFASRSQCPVCRDKELEYGR